MQGKEIEFWFQKEFGRKIGKNHVYDCNDYYIYVKSPYEEFPNQEAAEKGSPKGSETDSQKSNEKGSAKRKGKKKSDWIDVEKVEWEEITMGLLAESAKLKAEKARLKAEEAKLKAEKEKREAAEEERIAREAAEKKLQQSAKVNLNMALIIYAVVFVILMLFLGTSCTTVKYVPVPSITAIKDSTVIRDSLRITERLDIRDSVAVRDSVVNVVDEEGNLIRKELYHTREIIRTERKEIEQLQAALKDALSAKQDSIRVPYPVEKPLTKWQQWKQDAGDISFILNIILAGILGLVLQRKLCKRIR